MTRARATTRAVGEEQYTCGGKIRATRGQASESGRSGVKGTRKRTHDENDGGRGRRASFEDECVLDISTECSCLKRFEQKRREDDAGTQDEK